MNPNHESLNERLARTDRLIRRDQMVKRIRELGGYVPEPNGNDASEIELTFLARVLAWETGPSATHGEWLARHGLVFLPPEALTDERLQTELWRLIEALALARVFLEHTDHLDDTELYARIWNDILPAAAPDFARTVDDACHWDFADPAGDNEQLWLMYYASESERRIWVEEFREVILPARRRPPHRRDHRLPVPR